MRTLKLLALCLCCTLVGLSIGLFVNTLTLYDAHSSALQDKTQYYQILTQTNPALASELSQSLKSVTLPYHLCQTRSLHQLLQTSGLDNPAVNGLLQSNYALYQLETELAKQEFCAGKEYSWL